MSAVHLTFHQEERWFAVPVGDVAEVTEAGPVARLPFSPAYVRGVATVHGQVLPSIDPLLLPGAPGHDARGGDVRTRPAAPLHVVVRTGRGPMALGAGGLGSPIVPGGDAEFDPFAGPVLRTVVEEDRRYLLLDPERIELAMGLALAEAPVALMPELEPPASLPEPMARLLLAEVGGRLLALETDGLAYVAPAGEVRPLPRRGGRLAGMARLRGRAVPLLELLGRPCAEAPLAIVYATARGELGVLADAVRGMARVPLSVLRDGTVELGGAVVPVAGGMAMIENSLEGIARLVPDWTPPEPPQAKRVMRRLVPLRVGGRLYALELGRVRRVVPFAGAASLPPADAGPDGVFGRDGDVMPSVDLRAVLGEGTPREAGVALVVEAGGGQVALVADAVLRIRRVAEDLVSPVEDALTEAMAELDGALVPLLRPDGLYAQMRGAADAR
ncbi:MAG TPA: chemotaxis protein CheW [Azospirillaceae bacterium]|nr:chemotaxis protein CheW [Azospirillaceae bacterium]